MKKNLGFFILTEIMNHGENILKQRNVSDLFWAGTNVILDILHGQERPEVDDYLRFIHPISVYATDSYIYTLNLDMTTEEIENRKTTPNIQVFDWEGKPLTQYKLDCFINTFVVDEVANKIYGAFVEDEDHIYVFNLPRL